MSNDLKITFVLDQPAKLVFDAVNDVTKWWTENLKGGTKKINDEFEVQFEDIHYSKQKLEELIPNKKVTWLVTESNLSWLKNKQEWTGTRIVFEIFERSKGTELQFTHIGLNRGVECYKDCFNGWTQYINLSLYKLITSGKGQPEKKISYANE